MTTALYYISVSPEVPHPRARIRNARPPPSLASALVQRTALDAAAAERGWTVREIVADDGTSRDMPGFARLKMLIARRDADVVAVYSLNVLGRSFAELVELLRLVQKARVALVILKERLNTADPGGASFLQNFELAGAYAFDIASQRTRMALMRASTEGKNIGRPRVGQRVENAVRKELRLGVGVLTAARRTGVSKSSAWRINREMNAEIKAKLVRPVPTTEGVE